MYSLYASLLHCSMYLCTKDDFLVFVFLVELGNYIWLCCSLVVFARLSIVIVLSVSSSVFLSLPSSFKHM